MDKLQKVFTPLHMAAARNSFDVAELLIRSGADVNAKGYVSIVHISNVCSPLFYVIISIRCLICLISFALGSFTNLL